MQAQRFQRDLKHRGSVVLSGILRDDKETQMTALHAFITPQLKGHFLLVWGVEFKRDQYLAVLFDEFVVLCNFVLHFNYVDNLFA